MNITKESDIQVIEFDKFDNEIRNVARKAAPNFQTMFDCMEKINQENDSYSKRFSSVWNGLITAENTVQRISNAADVSESEVVELAGNLVDAISYLQDKRFSTWRFIDTFRSLNGKVFECKDCFPVLS